jgi:hypothetical protein
MLLLFKHTRAGWFYRVGSRSPWVGPFVTRHVTCCVRDYVTKQPWGLRVESCS